MTLTDEINKIDLHMHTLISDGTDTPAGILEKVRAAGIGLFSVTDHDAIKACGMIREILTGDDPLFISGIEFSCKDKLGKYHILGYGYDAEALAIRSIVEEGHNNRIRKTRERIEKLRTVFGISFDEDDLRLLFKNNNPGKPHIAKLMIKYGYADSIKQAFEEYLNKTSIPTIYIRPEKAVTAILESGGIPVLAHPSYGSGDELILGEEMDQRLRRLIGFGLQGVEAFYSGFSYKMRDEMLDFAVKYGLYVTAGSDYHGENKTIFLGDTGLGDLNEIPEGLKRFLEDVTMR